MDIVWAALGALLVVLAWGSVLSTLVVARRSRNRTTKAINFVVAGGYAMITRRISAYDRRDKVWATQPAAFIIIQLLIWLVMLYVGFAGLLYMFDERTAAAAFAQSGSSLFTLGYAQATDAQLSAVDYLAAASGLVVVGLQIGYLPTLYGAFNRRETEVRLLSSRAGTPAWGPEVLARTRFGVSQGDEGAVMDEFYSDWERWAADVSESHTNYPVLTTFRSPQRYASWIVALLAVMDSAALWLSLAPSSAPSAPARLCLRMGFLAMHAIADTLNIDVAKIEKPGKVELTYDDFEAGVDHVADSGFTLDRTVDQAWPKFQAWRVNYEAVAYALADRLDAVPARWSGPRRSGEAPIPPVQPRFHPPS